MTGSPYPTTILIVEDDDGHALLIQDNLQEGGVRNPIKRFQDGQSALDFFASTPVDRGRFLILLDIRMPKVDGIEVLQRLKADPKTRSVPIIMLTTTDDTRDVQKCHELGCSGYIQKPVDYSHFSEAIQRIGHYVPLLLVPEIRPPEGAMGR